MCTESEVKQVCIFLFLATDFTGDLGKPDFLFYRPV